MMRQWVIRYQCAAVFERDHMMANTVISLVMEYAGTNGSKGSHYSDGNSSRLQATKRKHHIVVSDSLNWVKWIIYGAVCFA